VKFLVALALLIFTSAAQAKLEYGWVIKKDHRFQCMQYLQDSEFLKILPKPAPIQKCADRFGYELSFMWDAQCYPIDVSGIPIGKISVAPARCKRLNGWDYSLIHGLRCVGFNENKKTPVARLDEKECAEKFKLETTWTGRQRCNALDYKGVAVTDVEMEKCR
jgi:hypothetical protein